MSTLEFDPILCFARNPRQTPDEVFDMLQERMMTLLGKAYSDKGVGLCNWVGVEQADETELAALADWQASSLVLDSFDFERLGAQTGLSMVDVLGRPKVTPEQRKAVLNAVVQNDGGSFDPVIAFVTLSVFERIDEIARERRGMAETQRITA